MSLVLQSSGGGSVTIQEPSTASNFNATFPAATGTVLVSGNQPAFRAYASTGTAISAGGTSKIAFDTESYDTNNNFASNRFTPTVAGYYQISIGARPTSTTGECAVYIWLNGANYQTLYDSTTTNLYNISSSSLVYMNGSTDYLEVYMYSQLGGTTGTGSSGVWFSGVLVRNA